MLNRQWLAKSKQAGYLTLTGVTLSFALAGIVLPLLPTTPFLLIAVWAAPKASVRIHQWLLDHPQMGPLLRAWREQGAVSNSAKWLACLMLTISWLVLVITASPWWMLTLSACSFSGIAIFLITRPVPSFTPLQKLSTTGISMEEQVCNDIRAFYAVEIYADIRAYQDAEVYHA